MFGRCIRVGFITFLVCGKMLLDFGFLKEKALWILRHSRSWCHDCTEYVNFLVQRNTISSKILKSKNDSSKFNQTLPSILLNFTNCSSISRNLPVLGILKKILKNSKSFFMKIVTNKRMWPLHWCTEFHSISRPVYELLGSDIRHAISSGKNCKLNKPSWRVGITCSVASWWYKHFEKYLKYIYKYAKPRRHMTFQ